MNKTLSITEVVRHFAEYINRVAHQGEHFVLLRGKKPVAELRPVSTGRHLDELPDLLKSLPHLSKEEADGFAKDISETRTLLSKENLRNPWES